jgi:hypothetical protein
MGGKVKRGRTVSDDPGGKSLSDTSTSIGYSDLVKVQEDLCGNKLGMLKQECKTRWSSTHNCGLSLMKSLEMSIRTQ